MNKKQNLGVISLILPTIFLIITAFALLVFRDEGYFDFSALIVAAALILLIVIHYAICTRLFKQIDKYVLTIIYLLCAISMIMQYRINYEYANRQLLFIAIGMGCMILAMVIFSNIEFWFNLKYPLMIISVLILIVVIAIAQARGGAKNWLAIGGFSFQPSEFIKIVLIIVLAAYMGEMENKRSLLPLLIFVGVCAILLVLSRDLGMALIYALCSLIVFFAATGDYKFTLIGLGIGGIFAYISYFTFSHIKVRVSAWLNPFSTYLTNGYQIAQGLMAIASGGLFGMGLTLGSPKSIPEYHTDYIFAVICEEMGLIVGIGIILLYFIFALRAFIILNKAENPYDKLIALGVATIFTIQTFLIIGGIIKLIPLTGVTLPFVSYGGSSMIVSFILVGLLLSRTAKLENSKGSR